MKEYTDTKVNNNNNNNVKEKEKNSKAMMITTIIYGEELLQVRTYWTILLTIRILAVAE
jgi:hypothetical protein